MIPKEVKIIYEDGSNTISNKKIVSFLEKHWGSKNIVSCGKITDASTLPRITAINKDGELIGLATYDINPTYKSCELISIDSTVSGKGVGSHLLKRVEAIAKKAGCLKIWLITTNDNFKAAIFYIKNKYRLVAIYLDALDRSRELKPQIPKIGNNGIPLQDEWKFEKYLIASPS